MEEAIKKGAPWALALIGRAAAVLAIALGALLHASAQSPATRTIVFFGDSLTAGYGLSDPGTQSYPAQIQRKIDAEHLPWRVVNAGLSGETSAGGLRRIDWVLNQEADIFFLELGANDGLRGTATDVTRANLQAILDHVHLKYPAARIVIAGMRMPPNMGQEYTDSFQAVFPALAKKNRTALVPFLLEGVAENPKLNQGDGMHPNPEGAALVADNVWKVIRPLLLVDRSY
ncbi:MAG: arylesterase [Opitutaceae bacterium]|jgi:acyl-CoA thioesterase-1